MGEEALFSQRRGWAGRPGQVWMQVNVGGKGVVRLSGVAPNSQSGSITFLREILVRLKDYSHFRLYDVSVGDLFESLSTGSHMLPRTYQLTLRREI